MLVWLANNQLSNCTHVNWHSPPEGFKYESLKQLSAHGLVHVESMYDGDELIGIHPIVKEFIASRENGEKA